MANSIGEEPTARTLSTGLVGPVPYFASGVSRSNLVRGV